MAGLIRDQAVTGPLKEAPRLWSDRDPADAARDARRLAEALNRRADEAL